MTQKIRSEIFNLLHKYGINPLSTNEFAMLCYALHALYDAGEVITLDNMTDIESDIVLFLASQISPHPFRFIHTYWNKEYDRQIVHGFSLFRVEIIPLLNAFCTQHTIKHLIKTNNWLECNYYNGASRMWTQVSEGLRKRTHLWEAIKSKVIPHVAYWERMAVQRLAFPIRDEYELKD